MTDTDADQYRGEWTGKTGRAPSDVYVPLALRGYVPSDDGDATGGGPYTPGSAIEEFGGGE